MSSGAPQSQEKAAEIAEIQNNRFDEGYFSIYHEDPAREAMYTREHAFLTSHKPDGGRILDIGCGLGGFLKHFNTGEWERFGVDVSDVAIAHARKQDIKLNEYDQAYDYPNDYFDIIVMRGSLQHLPAPFDTIQRCIEILKPGGILAILATPNSNSPYFRRFGTLPILTAEYNFLIPSDIMMKNALQNFGLEVFAIKHPYLDSPYAKPVRDHLNYLLSFLGVKRKFAFWKSMMEVYARKPLTRGAQ